MRDHIIVLPKITKKRRAIARGMAVIGNDGSTQLQIGVIHNDGFAHTDFGIVADGIAEVETSSGAMTAIFGGTVTVVVKIESAFVRKSVWGDEPIAVNR